MPSIITVPDRTRRDSRGVSEEVAQEYVDLMETCEEGQGVTVDDSESDGYEKSYSRGERIRTAIKKFKLTESTVTVKSVQDEDGKFSAVILFKD